MQQAVLKVSGLCMLAAFCSRLLQKNRFHNAIRLMLGLELVQVLFELLGEFAAGMLKWS